MVFRRGHNKAILHNSKIATAYSYFLTEVLRTTCQTQHVHKYTESDKCRLQVCSFELCFVWRKNEDATIKAIPLPMCHVQVT